MNNTEKSHLGRRIWPLLALASTEDGQLSPVQMQKTLFLLGEKIPSVTRFQWYHFEPYHYGPFDHAVYDDLEALKHLGMIEQIGDEGKRVFVITDRGRAVTNKLTVDAFLASNNAYLMRLTAWIKSLSFSQLIKSVYSAFPDFQKNSIFRD